MSIHNNNNFKKSADNNKTIEIFLATDLNINS